MRRFVLRILPLACCVLFAAACSIQKDADEKLRDIEFTVVDPQEVPQKLKDQIEEEKEKPFRLTYGDNGWLYLARGYGERNSSGYSVEVKSCYETENAVCFQTQLLGPSGGEAKEGSTWPYVVVKMEYCDKNVLFD